MQKRLRLVDGTTMAVDDAWEDTQGVWYRRGGVTHLVERSRVNKIERSAPANEKKAAQEAPRAKVVEINAKVEEKSAETSQSIQPVWIYLIGGARVEVDEVTEMATGVWYRRGTLSIFIERARIERIEREPQQAADGQPTLARAWKERGWTTGNTKIDLLIKQNGARYGVDPYLIFCVMEQESHFNPRAVSPVGARGLMQLMPGTGARFGVRQPFDTAQNIMGGTRYLRQLLDYFGGRVDLVLAGYNAGEGAVMKYGRNVPPYRETRNYVKRITARYQQSQPPTATMRPATAVATTSRSR